MFNALNRFISRLDGDGSSQREGSPGSYGFQVLRNTNTYLTIEPWYDFVVGINGRMIDNPSADLFAQEVRNCAGSTVSLGLWSAKGQRTRTMHIPAPPGGGGIGLSLQWAPLSLATNVWHVLDVPANSPADAAGLLPFGDYILGEVPTSTASPSSHSSSTPTPDPAASSSSSSDPTTRGPAGTTPATTTVLLHGESGLGELVEDHLGRPLRLWVYNVEYDATREV